MTFHLIRSVVLATGLTLASLSAQAIDRADPATLGFDGAKLAEITTALKADIAAGKLNGATVSVLRGGRLAVHQAIGTRGGKGDGAGQPLKTDDLFRIYSMTKPIVSVATMMLVEQGKVALTDPVSKFIPAFADTKVLELGELYAPDQPITIADLLRHTSGIVYGFFGDTEVRSQYKKAGLFDITVSTEEHMNRLAALPLESQPGENWEYGRSTDVLGRVVEVVSGQPLDRFLKSEILDPLGMKDTAFHLTAKDQARIVEPGFPGLLDPLVKPVYLSGGGGLMSSAPDYLNFVQMLLNGGSLNGKTILKPETVADMATDHLGDARPGLYDLLTDDYGFGYGFAVRLEDNGFAAGSKGDYWWGGYAGTYFWVDPAKDMAVVFMMQAPEMRNHYRPLLRNWVYGAMTGPVKN